MRCQQSGGSISSASYNDLLLRGALLQVDIERKYCAGPYENQNAHARRTEFNFGQWAPPDYRAHYEHTSLTLDLDADKPLLIVHNKCAAQDQTGLAHSHTYRELCSVSAACRFTQEWDGPPVNFIDVATLLALFEMLTPRYTCVYIRPHPGQKLEGYAFDHSNALEFDDFQAIQEAFPQVKFFHTLLAEHRQMSFNDLQLALHSRAENYVSVLGGNAVLASYFARSNVIYAVKGQEVGNVGFEYKELYAKLSPSHNATVLHAATYKQLLELVQKQYMQS